MTSQTDYSTEILALQKARLQMQSDKKLVEIEVKQKYAERIRDEIKRRTEAIELEFAHDLAEAHARGVPQSLIRSDVLRTNVWSRWTYWRDLAQIQPDRVIAATRNADSKRKGSAFQLSDDGLVLTVTKWRETDLKTPVEYDMSTIRKLGGRWWPDAFVESHEREAMDVAGGGGPWTRWLDEGITAEIEAGTIKIEGEM
jgi:hypothetical protein